MLLYVVETSSELLNTKFNYRVQNAPPLLNILSEFNPVWIQHMLIIYVKATFYLPFYDRFFLPSGLRFLISHLHCSMSHPIELIAQITFGDENKLLSSPLRNFIIQILTPLSPVTKPS